MTVKIPEKNKKPGVCYAWTDDGLELPVIDVTHPAFAFEVGEAELSALIDQAVRSVNVAPAALQAAAQKSLLVRGMVESSGTYTSGMMTYLNKLGPDNLGDGYASPIDHQWAASLTPLTFRWRMRDVARLLADGLAPALAARPHRPVHMLNIGGGPAMDSLNALILLRKEHPDVAGRAACRCPRARPRQGRSGLRRPRAGRAAARTARRCTDWRRPSSSSSTTGPTPGSCAR